VTKGVSESSGSVLTGDILKGMKFPVRKEQILQYVRGQNVTNDVIEDLQRLPDREYESAESVMKALEASGQQSSQQAGGGGGGKSQGFGGTGTGGSGGGGPSTGGSSQSFGGRGGK